MEGTDLFDRFHCYNILHMYGRNSVVMWIKCSESFAIDSCLPHVISCHIFWKWSNIKYHLTTVKWYFQIPFLDSKGKDERSMYLYTYMHAYTCVHAYIHSYMHTYTHASILSQFFHVIIIRVLIRSCFLFGVLETLDAQADTFHTKVLFGICLLST